ncbi:hypothetical protein HKD37_09G025222 [Glycine soja]
MPLRRLVIMALEVVDYNPSQANEFRGIKSHVKQEQIGRTLVKDRDTRVGINLGGKGNVFGLQVSRERFPADFRREEKEKSDFKHEEKEKSECKVFERAGCEMSTWHLRKERLLLHIHKSDMIDELMKHWA